MAGANTTGGARRTTQPAYAAGDDVNGRSDHRPCSYGHTQMWASISIIIALFVPGSGASSSSGAALDLFRPLFDVDTPGPDLPRLIRDLAAHPDLGQADTRAITLAQAAFLTDRIVAGPYPIAEQVELLRLLLERFSTPAFLPVIAGEMTAIDDDHGAVLARFPLALLAEGMPFVALADEDAHAGDETDAGAALLIPDVIVEQVWTLARAFPDWLRVPGEYDPAAVQWVRNQFPAPFHLVFPFNAWMGRQLIADVAKLPSRSERYRAVRGLARHGIRFDLDDVLGLGLDPRDPYLAAMLPYARPCRHLFDGVRYNPDHGGHLRRAALAATDDDGETDDEGVAPAEAAPPGGRAAIQWHPYLPLLYGLPGFVALVRRQLPLFTASVARLPPDAYWTLGAQPFLAYAECAELANLLVLELAQAQLRSAQPLLPAQAAVLSGLLALPQVDLLGPVPSMPWTSLFAWLCQFAAWFSSLLCSPQLLARLAADLPEFERYLERIGAHDRIFVLDFLDQYDHVRLVARLNDYLRQRPAPRRCCWPCS